MIKKININSSSINLNPIANVFFEKNLKLKLFYQFNFLFFFSLRYFNKKTGASCFSIKLFFFRGSNYFRISLKKRQIFFCLLGSNFKLFKSFSCGFLMKFFKKKNKKDKYSLKNQASFLFFFKKYFNFFLRKKVILLIVSYKHKYKKTIDDALTLFQKNLTSVHFLPRINNFEYTFKRVRAIKRKIRRKLI